MVPARLRAVLFGCLALLASEGSARADDTSRWYGGQQLALDVTSLGLGAAGVGVLASDAPKGVALGVGLPLLLTGALGYVLTSPVLHAVHGHPVDPARDPTMRNAAYARLTGLFLGLGVAFFGGLAANGGIGDRPPSYAPSPAAVVIPVGSIALGVTIPIVLDLALWTYEPAARR